jgi:magnesium-transporting ATPase (P-type)
MALNKFNDSKNLIYVKWGGEEISINIDDLKVGDIAKIKTGLAIPCDAILVPDSTGVLCDEAAMTGESEECKKDIPENRLLKRKEFLEDETSPADRNSHSIPSPLLMSGTQISTGEGWFMIIVVWKNSAMGIINSKIQ